MKDLRFAIQLSTVVAIGKENCHINSTFSLFGMNNDRGYTFLTRDLVGLSFYIANSAIEYLYTQKEGQTSKYILYVHVINISLPI